MKFDQPFLQLPKRFCADTLAREVAALDASAWVAHPGKLPGNDAVLLITPGGELTHSVSGPMQPTDHLLACPYILQVMEELGGVWGRSRLMGLAPGAEVPPHVDLNYYWRTHIRIHIPVVTNPQVEFTCEDETVHMSEGECWIFDSFRPHRVRNGGKDKRVHLVLDTVGGDRFWKTVDDAIAGTPRPDAPLLPAASASHALDYEVLNTPTVMSPWEIRCHSRYLLDRVAHATPAVRKVEARLDRFADEWMAIWASRDPSGQVADEYGARIAAVKRDLQALGAGMIALTNSAPLDRALDESIFRFALPSGPATVPARLAEPLRRVAS